MVTFFFKYDNNNENNNMHNLESVQENEIPKILWDSEVPTDHLLSARWPDLAIVHKKKEPAE